MSKRLKNKINGGVGNAKEDFPRINGVAGGQAGPKAGVIIDGAVYPLEGEPPTAETKGWGEVPGKS
jgi:hypothetical protein